MSQYLDGPRMTVLAGTALGINLRVKITDATTSPITVGLAGVNDASLGVTEEYVVSGDRTAIFLANATGTRKMSATAVAITGGNTVYAAASGQIASTGSIVEGIALEAAAGSAGEIIEVIPTVGGAVIPQILAVVQQAIAGAGAVSITEFYTAVTNTGADALTLIDGVVIGQLKKIQMIVDPGTDSTLTPSNLSGGATITFADVGDYAVLCWDGTNWVAIELGNDADGVSGPVLA